MWINKWKLLIYYPRITDMVANSYIKDKRKAFGNNVPYQLHKYLS